jgi:FkbM family methyltransferase
MYALIKRFGSLTKKLCLAYRGAFYTYKEKINTPIKLDYKKGQLSVRLYPKGQIAKPLYTNQYEQSEINLVIDFLKPGMNVLDIGANIGLYSLIAEKIVSPSGTIWAFEPSTENFDRLKANLTLNKVLKVNPVQLALADIEDEMIVLLRDRGFGDGERYLALQQGPKYTRNTAVNDSGDIERVRVTTLDSFLYKEIKTPKIDFIKIDIEGGELRVFRGASRTLAENPDIMIFFECAPLCCQRAGNTTEEVFQYLRTFGFEIYAMNKSSRKWESNHELISTVGNLWACRHKEMLPVLY